jgi:hypothetical protein
METEIRELMQERADEVRGTPELPAPTLRRARRRRRLTASLAGLTTFLVVAGAVVGLQAAFPHSGTSPGESPAPAPTAGTPSSPFAATDHAFPGIWPEENEADLIAAQDEIDGGALTWRKDPVATAEHFTVAVLGWAPNDLRVTEALLDGGVVREHVFDDTLTRMSGIAPGETKYAETLFLRQLGRDGQDGAWSVVDATSELIDTACPLPQVVHWGESIHVCGGAHWDPSMGSVNAWFSPGDQGSPDLARGEASPFAQGPITGGTFDVTLGPIPNGLGDHGMLVVELQNAGGPTIGVLATTIAISAPSASGSSPEGPTGLTAAAAQTRAAIIKAVGASNYGALQELIDPDQFQFTFGGVSPGTPVADQAITSWKEQGPEPLRIMGALLDMPYTTEPAEGGDIYVWPAILTWSPDQLSRIDELAPEWRSALEGIYPDFDQQLHSWIQSGGYLGWRIGITEDGRWIYFLAGD